MFAYCGNNPVTGFDPTGQFGWFLAANAVIGAVVGATSQIVTNVLTGNDDIFSGVVGAAVGGAVYNVVGVVSGGNLLAASAAGAAAEAVINEVGAYLSGDKELNVSNVLGSGSNIVVQTASNTLTALVTGNIASNLVKINSGWFKPQQFVSSFTGKYATKVWQQTAVQGALVTGLNTVKNWLGKLDREVTVHD